MCYLFFVMCVCMCFYLFIYFYFINFNVFVIGCYLFFLMSCSLQCVMGFFVKWVVICNVYE